MVSQVQALIIAPTCGHACHVAVKAKDYVFHPYQKR